MCLYEFIGNFNSRPLFEWSQSTIDNILVQGDCMYVKALNNCLFGINPGIELTSIDNLPRFVEVSCNMNILSFELIDTTINNINYEEPPVLHAESSNAHINSCDNNVVPVAVHRNIELPVMVAKNNQLPVMVDKDNQLPVMVDKNNQLPVMVDKNNQLPVMVDKDNQLPVMVDKNNQLPVMVDKNNQLPVMVDKDNQLPVMVDKDNQLPVMVDKNNQLLIGVGQNNSEHTDYKKD